MPERSPGSLFPFEYFFPLVLCDPFMHQKAYGKQQWNKGISLGSRRWGIGVLVQKIVFVSTLGDGEHIYFWCNAKKGSQPWINLLQVIAISHTVTLGFQHLELVVVVGGTPPWQGLTLSAYYRESQVCSSTSYCKSKSQMHSETHHGNRNTVLPFVFILESFTRSMLSAYFASIFSVLCDTWEKRLFWISL